MAKNYQIKLTDEDVKLIIEALLTTSRIKLGQWYFAFEELYPNGYGLEKLDKRYRAIFIFIQELERHPKKILLSSRPDVKRTIKLIERFKKIEEVK